MLVYDGAEALRQLFSEEETFDLVILDMIRYGLDVQENP